MDMNVIREHLTSDEVMDSLVGENIFLFEKPEKAEANTYIIYNFKEINGATGGIRNYQLDIHIVAKDKLLLFPIRERLIELLDNYDKPTIIKDSSTIVRHTRLINGGGMIKNQESGEYNLLIYFLVKI